MGVVYAAYDPELDRKIALKLLRTGTSQDGAARLQREALALAKLSHPNVVAIHDVGLRCDEVWLAMEFVAGRTIGAWLSDRARVWTEILAVLRSTALGLAAAHEAGLVHRDVKPDNVMIGDDGRVRVMDFGLARGWGNETPEPSDTSSLTSARQRQFEAMLTGVGATPGTPAYMAPEQFAGEPTDARTDQFAFCVMSWEALYGERPFAGKTVPELANNVLEGKPRLAQRSAAVPGWLRTVLLRGLAVDSDDRWSSLTALLRALDLGRRRARLRRILGAVGAALAAVASVFIVRHLGERHHRLACEQEGNAIASVWNDDERELVRAGLLATRAEHAEVTAQKVTPWIDTHARRWAEARTDTCMDEGAGSSPEANLTDRSVWCLEERRLELSALVSVFKRADVEVMTRAVPAAAGLRDVKPCRDPAWLVRVPLPTAEARAAVEGLRADLSTVRALHFTGQYADALELARNLVDDADALEWPPLRAAARREVGGLLSATGEYTASETVLERAYFEAAGSGEFEVALSAAQELATVVGEHLGRIPDGERWDKHAEIVRSTLPDPAGLREAYSLDKRGALRRRSGAYAKAAALLQRALSIREAALGPAHPDVARTINDLANVHWAAGKMDEAAKLHERAGGIFEEVLGPEHPYVAASLNNLGVLRRDAGAYDEAEELHGRAVAIWKKTLGAEHPHVATGLDNLGLVRKAQGDYEGAARLHERALTIWEKTVGSDHVNYALCLNNLGNVREAMGAYDEAAAFLERALSIWEKAYGPDHPDVAASLNNLALVREATGDTDAASALFERALAIWEKALGPEHALVADPLLGLARIALARNHPAVALPLAERALKVRELGNQPPVDLAAARLLLARVLIAAHESESRAILLARAAADAYRGAGDANRDNLQAAEALLAEQDEASGSGSITANADVKE